MALCAQAKASFVYEAFATMEEMQQDPHFIQPDVIFCNILLKACSRADPPCVAKARLVMEEIMPRHRIIPNGCLPYRASLAEYGFGSWVPLTRALPRPGFRVDVGVAPSQLPLHRGFRGNSVNHCI